MDDQDQGNLEDTAIREAQEEIGSLPPDFKIVDRVLTKRGKGSKHYTVFIALVSPKIHQNYKPLLNEEHNAYQWFKLTDLPSKEDLHPVVKKFFKKEDGIQILKKYQ